MPEKSDSIASSSMNLTDSGRSCMPMPMKRGFRSSGISRSMWHLTARIPGRRPEMFQFDENNEPTGVAGCPPDAFSATGQLWGNPLYDWEYHKKTGYGWWIRRIAYCFKLYDVVRIDHFRGFDEYYAIPYGDKTAENGKWLPRTGNGSFPCGRGKARKAGDYCRRSWLPHTQRAEAFKRQRISRK